MMEQQKKSQEAAVSLLRKKVKKLEALQRELTQRIEKLYEDAVIDNLFSRDAYTAQKARLVEQRDDAHRAEAEIQAELFERTRDCSIYMERYRLSSANSLGRSLTLRSFTRTTHRDGSIYMSPTWKSRACVPLSCV